jgi:chromatin segregation and condensation protein Rec8/ScpA/Scc1 (kleisin family)
MLLIVGVLWTMNHRWNDELTALGAPPGEERRFRRLVDLLAEDERLLDRVLARHQCGCSQGLRRENGRLPSRRRETERALAHPRRKSLRRERVHAFVASRTTRVERHLWVAGSSPLVRFSRNGGEAERAQEVPDSESEARRSEGGRQERAAPAEKREAQAA